MYVKRKIVVRLEDREKTTMSEAIGILSTVCEEFEDECEQCPLVKHCDKLQQPPYKYLREMLSDLVKNT